MKNSRQLILAAAIGCLSLGAQAANSVNAADVPRISNGGTGFIGLTESAGTPRTPYVHSRASTSGVPMQAGEASTLVDGVPNQQTVASAGDRGAVQNAYRADLRTMGHSGRATAEVHPSWGTPK